MIRIFLSILYKNTILWKIIANLFIFKLYIFLFIYLLLYLLYYLFILQRIVSLKTDNLYHSEQKICFTFVEETAEKKTKSHNRHAVWQVEEKDQGGIGEVKNFGSSGLNDDDSDCKRNS